MCSPLFSCVNWCQWLTVISTPTHAAWHVKWQCWWQIVHTLSIGCFTCLLDAYISNRRSPVAAIPMTTLVFTPHCLTVILAIKTPIAQWRASYDTGNAVGNNRRPVEWKLYWYSKIIERNRTNLICMQDGVIGQNYSIEPGSIHNNSVLKHVTVELILEAIYIAWFNHIPQESFYHEIDCLARYPAGRRLWPCTGLVHDGGLVWDLWRVQRLSARDSEKQWTVSLGGQGLLTV